MSGSHNQVKFQIIEDGIHITVNNRCYVLKNIQFAAYHLKSNIRAFKTDEPKEKYHIDILNFYSSGARRSFAKDCATLFEEDISIIDNDLNKIINLLEEKKEELKKGTQSPAGKLEVMSNSEREEAMKFLTSPALFDEIVSDLTALGYVGEKVNKLTAYLSVTSRKLDDPLSIMITSRSAAGKSSLQDAILSLMPPEDFVKYTSLTGKALFYQDEYALQNKVLAIEEETGSKEASYSIRAIQSSKHLSIATTGRDSTTGKLKTEVYTVRGPVCIFFTTSAVDLDQETANRFLRLTVDESREQTQQIFERQRELETLEGLLLKDKTEKIVRKHQNAQRLLYPVKVVNPYAKNLTFNDETLRTRRDHKKYLNLIKTIAFIRQHQRGQKTIAVQGKTLPYIEVSPDDIKIANDLAGQIFAHTMEELSPPGRSLLLAIQEMVKKSINGNGYKPEEVVFTRKNIRDYTLWGNYQIKSHIRELHDLEYLIPISGGPRKRFQYQLNGGETAQPPLVLTDAAKLKSGKLGKSGRRPDLSLPGGKKNRLGAGREKNGDG